MEHNVEQIKKALEICWIRKGSCDGCPYECPSNACLDKLERDVIALINSQEQRIGELEKYNADMKVCGFSAKELAEKCERLTEERNTYREYAEKMQLFVESIKHKEEEGYEPSAARYVAEMEMWRVVALEKKELTEENEKLGIENFDLVCELSRIREATVRKMQSEIEKRCIKGGIYPAFVKSTIDQIAKEMLEEGK